jgi:hypothetical protein
MARYRFSLHDDGAWRGYVIGRGASEAEAEAEARRYLEETKANLTSGYTLTLVWRSSHAD